jgi:hypothetical protein
VRKTATAKSRFLQSILAVRRFKQKRAGAAAFRTLADIFIVPLHAIASEIDVTFQRDQATIVGK